MFPCNSKYNKKKFNWSARLACRPALACRSQTPITSPASSLMILPLAHSPSHSSLGVFKDARCAASLNPTDWLFPLPRKLPSLIHAFFISFKPLFKCLLICIVAFPHTHLAPPTYPALFYFSIELLIPYHTVAF